MSTPDDLVPWEEVAAAIGEPVVATRNVGARALHKLRCALVDRGIDERYAAEVLRAAYADLPVEPDHVDRDAAGTKRAACQGDIVGDDRSVPLQRLSPMRLRG